MCILGGDLYVDIKVENLILFAVCSTVVWSMCLLCFV